MPSPSPSTDPLCVPTVSDIIMVNICAIVVLVSTLAAFAAPSVTSTIAGVEMAVSTIGKAVVSVDPGIGSRSQVQGLIVPFRREG